MQLHVDFIYIALYTVNVMMHYIVNQIYSQQLFFAIYWKTGLRQLIFTIKM